MRTKRAGFTLIELLVAIAIIAVLATIVAVGLIPLKKRAYREKTKAMLQKVQTALDSYFNEFRDSPPDGYDKDVPWDVNADGVLLGQDPVKKTGGRRYKGSAVLIYFLCHPINNVTTIGADTGVNDPRQLRTKTIQPFLGDITKEHFSVSHYDDTFDPAVHPVDTVNFKTGWEKCEILDAWFRPIHYDKVREPDATFFSAKLFMTSGKTTHPDQTYYGMIGNGLSESDERICPLQKHDTFTNAATSTTDVHTDPRSPASPDGDGCLDTTKAATAPRNRNAFDLWSHGASWTNPRGAITNWGK